MKKRRNIRRLGFRQPSSAAARRRIFALQVDAMRVPARSPARFQGAQKFIDAIFFAASFRANAHQDQLRDRPLDAGATAERLPGHLERCQFLRDGFRFER